MSVLKNNKSDVRAKKEYSKYLENNGYKNVKIVGTPVDIIAEKENVLYYFEIKMTKSDKNCFGAATLTEWEQALKTPNEFKFIIARTDRDENIFEFLEFTPKEFLKFSTIPPFKFYFNIDLVNQNKIQKRTKAIQLNDDKISHLITIFNNLR
jgi:hypothetical protein